MDAARAEEVGRGMIVVAGSADLPARGQAYDLARDRANIRISVLSPTGLDSQIGHDGATWLDRELASPSRTTLANTGFGREVTEAMERRRQRRQDGGMLDRRGDDLHGDRGRDDALATIGVDKASVRPPQRLAINPPGPFGPSVTSR